MIFDIWDEIPNVRKYIFRLFIVVMVTFALMGFIGS